LKKDSNINLKKRAWQITSGVNACIFEMPMVILPFRFYIDREKTLIPDEIQTLNSGICV
jgi:hypothetical protein